MKTSLSLGLALLAVTSANAQIFRPEAVNGAVLGGVAGAIIGNNSGDLRHNAWKGAAIGAGAGLLIGEAVGNANANRTVVPSPLGSGYVYRSSPTVRVGVGYSVGGHGSRYVGHRGHDYRRGYGYYSGYYGPQFTTRLAPAYGYYEGYGDGYPYYSGSGYYGCGSAASNGLVLGALAGGIIGHNSGDFRHNGWRGAAWGAGAGWLLGTILDANRRPAYESAPVYVQQPAPTVQAAPAAAAPVQSTTIINNYYNTPSPMSSANGLFGR